MIWGRRKGRRGPEQERLGPQPRSERASRPGESPAVIRQKWPCSGTCCTTSSSFNKPSLGTSRGRSMVQELQAINPPRAPLRGLFKGDRSSTPLQLPTLLLTHKPHGKDLEKRPRKTFRAATRRKGTPALGNTASNLFWAQAKTTFSQKTSGLTLEPSV